MNTDSQGNETVTYGKPGDRNGARADGEWTVGKAKGNPGQIRTQPGMSVGPSLLPVARVPRIDAEAGHSLVGRDVSSVSKPPSTACGYNCGVRGCLEM
nr:hypothetical protein GCM10017611_05750 [Rhodococcus wratislaviensis]